MPTYTYACKQCGHRFDQRQSFTDPALTECPRCAGRLRKVLNSVGIVFKGSGFYRTDSRGSSNGALAGAAGDKAPSADKSSGNKSPAEASSGPSSAPNQPKSKAKEPAPVG
jgi:putative FmdB family regulatory protein